MKLTCLLRTTDYRGDHSAEVIIPIEIEENETVESLCKRLLRVKYDWLELRETWTRETKWTLE